MEYLNGWLSPEGKFYPCEYQGHEYLANKLEEELNLPFREDIWKRRAHGEELLEILHWIKLHATPWGKGNIFKYSYEEVITYDQVNFLNSVRDKMVDQQEMDFEHILAFSHLI